MHSFQTRAQSGAIHGFVKSVLLGILLLCLMACSPPSTNQASQDGSAQSKDALVFELAQVQQEYRGIAMKVLDISEREHDGRNDIAVTLSVPLNPANDHQSYFQVLDGENQKVDGAWVVDESGKIVWFNNTQPNAKYQVVVLAGLTAATGVKLAASEKQSLQTRNLEPSVSFDSSGVYLAKGLSHGLPVVSVNVAEVNIDFFRVNSSDINGFLQQVGGRYYYWQLPQVVQYGELVYSGRYALDAPKNTRSKRIINTANLQPLQQSGIYFAVMHAAGKYQQNQLLWFTVTDIGLQARFYDGQIEVQVSSLKTAKALPDIDIRLLDKDSNVMANKISDHKGSASFVGVDKSLHMIVAQAQGQYSIIQTRKPALDLSAFDLGRRPQLPLELFIYTPRDLFRPAEVVDFNALIRDGDGKEQPSPILQGRIKRPDGTVASSFTWQGQQLGYYHHSYQIPVNAPVGDWSLEVSGPFEQIQRYPFKVETFLPERMKLTFNPNQPAMAQSGVALGNQHADLKVPIVGEYLYGAPAAGNRVSTLVNITAWRNPVETLAQFEFGDVLDNFSHRQNELADIALDQNGMGQLQVPVTWQETHSPLSVKLISSLYETGGRPVSRTYSALVWPQAAMLGIRSEFDSDSGSDGPRQNSRVKFDIVKANLKGELQGAQNLDVQLIREDRQYFWVYDANQGWHYDWTDKEFVEASQTIDIAAGEMATVAFPVSYGSYRLVVSDPSANLRSSVKFFAGYNWYANWRNANRGSQAARPDQVTLALDQGGYKEGQVAKLNIVPPSAGEAIIMVEGDGPLWVKRVEVEKSGTVIEIPIDPKWQQHNLYISAMVLRPGDEQQAITPNRSFGLIHLPLDRQNRQLKVDIQLPEKWLPEQRVNAQLLVTQSDGQVVDGPVYVTVAAVDSGVLSISDFKTPDPFEWFFGRRAYGVQIRDIYDKVIELNHSSDARLRFGGDADISRGGKKPISDVQIVALFQGPFKVENGKATVALDLPDFNGQLRVMAVAFSNDQFGQGESNVIVAAPVVSQIAMPRFLAYGDEATVALDINNLSEQSQQLTVDFNASGAGQLVAQPQTLTLAAKQKTSLYYQVKATAAVGQIQFDLNIKGIKAGAQTSQITRRWHLGVRAEFPAQSYYQQQILNQAETFTLDPRILEPLIPGSVEAALSISNKADLNLAEQLKNLLGYPYGCLEQTSSQVFPLTYATAEQQRRFDLSPLTEDERLERINLGIERIASMQLSNGGFGLWRNTSPEEHWLTAYVADLLLSAREMGIEIPYQLLDSAMQRLRRYINHQGNYIQQRYSQDPNHYSFAYKAYAAYVLSRVNQAPLGSLRTLFDKKLDDAQTGLPKIQLGIALTKMGDKKRGQKAIDAGLANLNAAPFENEHYWGDYGSGVRDKAMAIHLLLRHQLNRSQALALSFSLAKDVHRKRWFSTQERNSLFLAGIALASQTSETWLAEVMLNSATRTLNNNHLYRQSLSETQLAQGVEVKSLNASPLYVTSTISGYGKNKPKPVSEGLTIERQWYSRQGEQVQPSQVKVGELYIVHIRVTAKTRTPDALVVDLLPAGFELENQNLTHAIKLENFTIEGQPLQTLLNRTQLKHQEYREDRYVAAIDINKYSAADLFYLLRAVTPGSYSVPAPMVEDMYNPERRAIGDTFESITVENDFAAQANP